ncbi:hypothetical protein ACTXJX_17380, partial [Glutamicibacter ardleyensis]|uniref:hypothetical protein n=1 Tax=Glutamicibacter ardleyensis TaxID=225894 RepID=UPI003FD5C597
QFCTNVVRHLIAEVGLSEQIKITDEVGNRLNMFSVTITPQDAIHRIAEMYEHEGHDPVALGLDFFQSDEWKEASESAKDGFWDDSGIELLNAPLHEWLNARGFTHVNALHRSK